MLLMFRPGEAFKFDWSEDYAVLVDKIGRNKARQVNARFAALASHYLFETD